MGAQVCVAQDFTYQGINYRVVDAEKRICETKPGVYENGGNNVSGALTIPDKVSDGTTEYSVIGIGDYSFHHCYSLTSVILPEGIEYIHQYGFDYCNKMTSINFPSSIKEMGQAAFNLCQSLKAVHLNPGLKTVSRSLFAGCAKLEVVTLPESIVHIDSMAFLSCSNLKGVILNEGLKTIDYMAFANCNDLNHVSLPASLDSVGDDLFKNAKFIMSVDYAASSPIAAPADIFSPKVYEQAELRMPSATLEEVKKVTPWNLFKSIHAKEESGDDTEFVYKGIIYTVLDAEKFTCQTKAGYKEEVPGGGLVRRIGNKYYGNLVLPSKVIHGANEYTVVAVGENGFDWNSYLPSVTIPTSVKSIGDCAFSDCHWLESVVLPDSLKNLGNDVFSGCVSLKSVRMPEYLDSIKMMTFFGCKISSFTWPKNLRYIGIQAFEGTALKEVVLPPGVEEIKVRAFARCANLTSIELPATISRVGYSLFADSDKLSSIVLNAKWELPVEALLGLSNPNVLLYVDNAQYAPDEKFLGEINVVEMNSEDVAGPVCRNLVVQPDYPFYPIKEFTALNATFTKSFTQATPVDGCGGWETVVLPFDVQSVTVDDSRGELTPFARFTNSRTQYPFWLYEADANSEWKEASEIKAGVPYLITMPNNEKYAERFRINGDVTFSSTSPVLVKAVSSEDHAVTWSNGHTFKPLWLPLDEEQADNAMGLNANIDNLTSDDGQILLPGSAFHIGVEPKPLEAYVTRIGTRMALPVMGAQSHVAIMEAENDLVVEEFDGALLLKSATDRVVSVYRPDGVCVASILLKAGEPSVTNSLPQGLYIVAGRKIIIK